GGGDGRGVHASRDSASSAHAHCDCSRKQGESALAPCRHLSLLGLGVNGSERGHFASVVCTVSFCDSRFIGGGSLAFRSFRINCRASFLATRAVVGGFIGLTSGIGSVGEGSGVICYKFN